VPVETDKETLAYEAEMGPKWVEPFSRLLLAAAPLEPRAQVLDVMSAAGEVTLPILERLEPRGRVIALDPSSGLLALMRRKAGGQIGKRLFLRHERPEKLSFADEVFDLVVSNAGVLELGDPNRSLVECVRVTKPGGALAMTLSLRGTFQELLDLLREVLERHDRDDALERLDDYIRSFPSDNEAIARFEGLGLRDVSLTRTTFPVEYASGRAFLDSALVAHRFLSSWTAVVGPESAPAFFSELASTIDTYFGLDPFEVTVQAACLVGRKEKADGAEEVATGPVEAAPAARIIDAASRPSPDEVTPVRAIPIPPEASAVGTPAEAASPSEGEPGPPRDPPADAGLSPSGESLAQEPGEASPAGPEAPKSGRRSRKAGPPPLPPQDAPPPGSPAAPEFGKSEAAASPTPPETGAEGGPRCES
jgi:ubiquinone/menaquinone biosynthesis C-methylase UbiE